MEKLGSTVVVAACAHFTVNGNAEAELLGVHRHTIRNRIDRIEQLTGRNLDDTPARLELSLAIHSRTGP